MIEKLSNLMICYQVINMQGLSFCIKYKTPIACQERGEKIFRYTEIWNYFMIKGVTTHSVFTYINNHW